MTDFPGARMSCVDNGALGGYSSFGMHSATGQSVIAQTFSAGAATWPANTYAIYMPFVVTEPCTATQMACQVTTQAGNLDLGIFSEDGVRLVNLGSTAVGAAGIQVANIADTALTPGVYFMAMSCSLNTAAFQRVAMQAVTARAGGVFQQSVTPPLPTTATFAAMAQAYIPVVWVATTSPTI